jgi:hypothetical protein
MSLKKIPSYLRNTASSKNKSPEKQVSKTSSQQQNILTPASNQTRGPQQQFSDRIFTPAGVVVSDVSLSGDVSREFVKNFQSPVGVNMYRRHFPPTKCWMRLQVETDRCHYITSLHRLVESQPCQSIHCYIYGSHTPLPTTTMRTCQESVQHPKPPLLDLTPFVQDP